MEKPPSAILLFWIVVVGILGAVTFFFEDPIAAYADKVLSAHKVYIHGDFPLEVTIADTEAKRLTGLGGRRMMSTREGMLFVFDQDKKWRIWSKGMNFGIDILWLDKDGFVMDMHEYVYPDSYPEVFEPNEPVRYILEVVAGFARANGIRVHDRIDLNF
jgi:uncharacterized membrane protein (UPF0127 family)